MRALQIKAFGKVETLDLVDVPDPIADATTAVVCVEAASINPSDVKNVAGAMIQITPPRIPGPRLCRGCPAEPGRMDRRGGVGHRRRCRRHMRWHSCRAHRRPDREPYIKLGRSK